MIIILFSITGCDEKVHPKGTLNMTIISKLKKSKNHEIKIKAEDIFMIDSSLYLVKIVLNDNKKEMLSYDLYACADVQSFYNLTGDDDSTIYYHLNNPSIIYTKDSDSKYILIKDNYKSFIDDGNNDTYKQLDVKIYIPEGTLNSLPKDNGKFGVQPNSKIN